MEDASWWLMPIILVTWEVEIGKIMVLVQPGQKVFEIPSQPKMLGVVVSACHPAITKSINRRIKVQSCLARKTKPYLKNNQNKKS
jgi:repressor of nif and glnA expression